MTGTRVANDPHAADRLAELLDWHAPAENGMTWADVEGISGVAVPVDFKRLMSLFPSGAFAERFYVYSPVQSARSLEKFHFYWRQSLDRLTRIRDSGRIRVPFPVYPESGGLIPWGIGDEHVYYWRTDSANPDEWTVVFSERSAIHWGEYFGNASSFLLDVITGRYSQPDLFYEPDDGELNFAAYDGMS